MKCVFVFLILVYSSLSNCATFEPTWESLDKRPLPQWYDDAKFGIFLHWGLYAIPGFGNEWFWSELANGQSEYVEYMKKNYPPNFTYQDFGRDFTAEFFEPEKWADLFEKAGAKYVVLTSKHHEGYTLWPSKYSFSWNAKDVGANRDLVGDLATAIRNKTDIKFGLYHSLLEWFNPLYESDKLSNFTNRIFAEQKVIPEMKELVEAYKPEVLWSDGAWESTSDYWQSAEFLAWLYNESPVKDTVVVNDRWGTDTLCAHGDFFNCVDHYDPGTLQSHKWEAATTIYSPSWGYIKNADITQFRTAWDLISLIARTVSCGGNVLLNIGPTKEGTIDPIFQERLLQIGEWLSVNGEAIYSTQPWTYQNDTLSTTWYTSKTGIVYAVTLEWPKENVLNLGVIGDIFKSDTVNVTLLGYDTPLKWKLEKDTVTINFPDKATVTTNWAWTVKVQY